MLTAQLVVGLRRRIVGTDSSISSRGTSENSGYQSPPNTPDCLGAILKTVVSQIKQKTNLGLHNGWMYWGLVYTVTIHSNQSLIWFEYCIAVWLDIGHCAVTSD